MDLTPSFLINFNNGTPDPEQRQLIENRIYQKFSGSSNSWKIYFVVSTIMLKLLQVLSLSN
jgi:hypothetical protein